MNEQNDWSRWQRQWQQEREPVLDVERLHRQVRRKQRRMRIAVALEALVVLFALVQLLRFERLPHLPPRWHLAAWAMLGFMLLLEWFSLHLRRGTWRLATASTHDLLALSVRRACAGIRLAWLQIAAVLVMLVIVLTAAWPWLQPDRWHHDPHLRLLLVLQIGINAPIVIGGVVLCFWYIRRQRRRLQQLEAWLQE